LTDPFLAVQERHASGPGSLEMAGPLVQALRVRPGMRVLEVGAGSGQVAAVLARHWAVSVVALEPWHGGEGVQAFAEREGVWAHVLALKTLAQELPFADASFDAVLSIGSFEMIGADRPRALAEMVRVARPGAGVGIAEPMCLPDDMPDGTRALDRALGLGFETLFRTVEWNRALFAAAGLDVSDARYFADAFPWWAAYAAEGRISPGEVQLIAHDAGRWLSLGMVVGWKRPV